MHPCQISNNLDKTEVINGSKSAVNFGIWARSSKEQYLNNISLFYLYIHFCCNSSSSKSHNISGYRAPWANFGRTKFLTTEMRSFVWQSQEKSTFIILPHNKGQTYSKEIKKAHKKHDTKICLEHFDGGKKRHGAHLPSIFLLSKPFKLRKPSTKKRLEVNNVALTLDPAGCCQHWENSQVSVMWVYKHLFQWSKWSHNMNRWSTDWRKGTLS